MGKKIRTAINVLTTILLIYLAYLLTSGGYKTDTNTNTINDNDSITIVDSITQ